MRVAVQQVFQVAVEEAVAPHRVEQRFQVEGLVRHRQPAALRRAQEAVDVGGVLGEQLGDDRLLVGEVVVQVPRRNAQVRGDVVGGDAALALGVEQLQAGLDDAVAGLDAWGHGGIRMHGRGPSVAYHLTV
ncbi:hypothetical protein D9M73_204690 [compost metagenome]